MRALRREGMVCALTASVATGTAAIGEQQCLASPYENATLHEPSGVFVQSARDRAAEPPFGVWPAL